MKMAPCIALLISCAAHASTQSLIRQAVQRIANSDPPECVDHNLNRLRAEATSLAEIASCQSVACATTAFHLIHRPDSAAKLVYYTRLVALRPRDRRYALDLLLNTPISQCEAIALSNLDSSLFETETFNEMSQVGSAYDNLSRNLADALKYYPSYLPTFLKFGEVALNDSCSDDFPAAVTRVCRWNPAQFRRAFQSLPKADQAYIEKFTIKPNSCKQIAVSEAGC